MGVQVISKYKHSCITSQVYNLKVNIYQKQKTVGDIAQLPSKSISPGLAYPGPLT